MDRPKKGSPRLQYYIMDFFNWQKVALKNFFSLILNEKNFFKCQQVKLKIKKVIPQDPQWIQKKLELFITIIQTSGKSFSRLLKSIVS